MNPDHINISHLNYSITSSQLIPPWSDATQSKHIVHDVWANIRVNKLTALMGSSGSAKTTLLNILSQRLVDTTATSLTVKSKHCVTGCVHFPDLASKPSGDQPASHTNVAANGDGKQRPANAPVTFGYVKQHDFLLPYYTVREYLSMCANLTLPHMSTEDKEAKITEIINLLGLTDCQHTRIGNRQQFIAGISGGEARRVSIAMQLLKNPDILFVDEVTTGLDSTTSYHIIQLLKMLCETNNITIIISLHQPRRDIFALFDDIILLAKGCVIYNGHVDAITPYFQSIGFICPDFTNNSDFIIDICAHDTRDEVRDVVSQERIRYMIERWKAVQRRDNFNPKSPLISDQSDIPCLLHQGTARPDSPSAPGVAEGGDHTNHGTVMAISPDCTPSPTIKHSTQSSFWTQYTTLTRRFLTSIFRDPLCIMGLIAQSLILAICYGIIFVDLGLSAEAIRMRVSLMYLSLTIVPYVSLVVHIYLQCRELVIFDHEYSERLYHPILYCFARLSAFIPTCTVVSVIATMVLLFMSNLRGTPAYNDMINSSPELLTPYVNIGGNAGHVIIHMAIASVVPYIFILALSMMCTAFQRGFASSSLIANSIFTFTSFTSGYFIKHDTIPVWLQWIKHISYIYHCFTVLMNNQFNGQSFYCPFVDPNDIPGTMDDPNCSQYDGMFILKTFEIDTSGYTLHILIPIIMMVVFLLIAMAMLTFVRASTAASVMAISNQVPPPSKKSKTSSGNNDQEDDEQAKANYEHNTKVKGTVATLYSHLLLIATQLHPSHYFSSFPSPKRVDPVEMEQQQSAAGAETTPSSIPPLASPPTYPSAELPTPPSALDAADSQPTTKSGSEPDQQRDILNTGHTYQVPHESPSTHVGVNPLTQTYAAPTVADPSSPSIVDFTRICPELSTLPYDLLTEWCLPEYTRQKQKLLSRTRGETNPSSASKRVSIKFNQFSLLVPMRTSRRQKLKAMFMPKKKQLISKTPLREDYEYNQHAALTEFKSEEYKQRSAYESLTKNNGTGGPARHSVDSPRAATAHKPPLDTALVAQHTPQLALDPATVADPTPDGGAIDGEDDGLQIPIEEDSDDDVNMIRFLARAQPSLSPVASTPRHPTGGLGISIATEPIKTDIDAPPTPCAKRSKKKSLSLPMTSITLNAVQYLPWYMSILNNTSYSGQIPALFPAIRPPRTKWSTLAQEAEIGRAHEMRQTKRESIPSSPSMMSIVSTHDITAKPGAPPAVFHPPLDYRILFKELTRVPARHIAANDTTSSDTDASSPPYISLIKNLSVEMHAGTSWAVLGASGSGKTSLLRYLIQQLDSDSYAIKGQSSINDFVINKTTSQKFIGYLSQQDVLLPHLTVYETLMYVARLKLCHKTIEEQDAIVRDVIRELNLVECQHNLVGGSGDGDPSASKGISGGEKRRTCIAIVLLSSPSILLLDEPTSGLDSFQSHVVCELLQKLARQDRLVIATLHQPRFDVFELFDNVILMAKSNIIYSGSVKNLVKYFESIPFIPRIQDYGISAAVSADDITSDSIGHHQLSKPLSSHGNNDAESTNTTNVNPADWVVDIMAIDYGHGSLIKHATSSRVLALAKIYYYRRVYIQQQISAYFQQFYEHPEEFNPHIDPSLPPHQQLLHLQTQHGSQSLSTEFAIYHDDARVECVVCKHCSVFYSLTSLSMPCRSRLDEFVPPQDSEIELRGKSQAAAPQLTHASGHHTTEIEMGSLAKTTQPTGATRDTTSAGPLSSINVVNNASKDLFRAVLSYSSPLTEEWLSHAHGAHHTSSEPTEHHQHSFVRIMVNKNVYEQFTRDTATLNQEYDHTVDSIHATTAPYLDDLKLSDDSTGADGGAIDTVANGAAVAIDTHTESALRKTNEEDPLASIAYNKPAPLSTAYSILLKRSFINLWRQPDLFYTRLSQTLAFGVLLTIFVGHMSYSQESLTSRIGISTLILSLASVGLLNALAVFPMERNMYYYEAHTDHNLYSSISFLLSYCSIEIAWQVVSSLLTAILVVFGCNLSAQHNFGDFILVAFVIFNMLLCGESLGMLFACCFYHIGFTVSVVTTIIATFDTMAGVLSIESELFYPLRIINKVSVHWYAVRAFALVDLYDREITCSPSDTVCLYSNGTEYLNLFGFDSYHSSFWMIIIMMPILNLVYRFLVYLVLSLHIPTMKTSSSNVLDEEDGDDSSAADGALADHVNSDSDHIYEAHLTPTPSLNRDFTQPSKGAGLHLPQSHA